MLCNIYVNLCDINIFMYLNFYISVFVIYMLIIYIVVDYNIMNKWWYGIISNIWFGMVLKMLIFYL